MNDRLDALRGSADRLRSLVGALDAPSLDEQAYPTEWTIADVLSHLGSGAVIMRRRIEDSVAGVETPGDAAPAVWEEWNAKSPTDQAASAVAADQELMAYLGGLTDEERRRFSMSMGPLAVDFDGVVGLRLNEHALHMWDIEVALDPTAVVAADAVGSVIDNLQMFARFTGKPVADAPPIVVVTNEPARTFLVTLGPDETGVEPTGDEVFPDLTLPAEAFVRLIYGRLDPEHTPSTVGTADLDVLRGVFPGA